MLIEFRFGNFRSFRDEQVLSMVAASGKGYDELPENVVEAGGLKLLRSAAIYGANASGKSNVINALTFAYLAVAGPNSLAGGDEEALLGKSSLLRSLFPGASPFRLDASSASKPRSFGGSETQPQTTHADMRVVQE